MFEERSYHTMVLVAVHADQSEEWHCPECGRRIAMQWAPECRLHVLEAGDEEASHVSANAVLSVAETPEFEAELEERQHAEALPAGTASLAGNERAYAVEAMIDFSDPEVTDGLAPWIRLLDRLSRDGLH